jgi:ABC-type nitrate/sulfonate/bicarbonate transport system permease component
MATVSTPASGGARFFDLRRMARLGTANERLFYGVLGFVVVSVIWELAADLGLYRRSLLSSPSAVWTAAVADFGNGTIWPHLQTSFTEYAYGFGLALLLGVPVGLAIGTFRRLNAFLSVLLFGIYSTPKAAVAPLIILVVGIGLESKVLLVFLLTFFSIIVSTMAGVRAAAERHHDIARSFGASGWLEFRSVVLPSTVPFLLTGLRIASGRALVGVVIAEELAANTGLGYYMAFYGTFLDTSRVMLAIVILGGFGILFGEVVRRIEKRFEVWRPDIR